MAALIKASYEPSRGSFRPAETIDEVITQLDGIVAQASRERGRAGYFAALYRGVTARVRDGIKRGDFEDGERMARLDVVFANRYLEALHRFRAGEPTSKCWQIAFTTAARWRPIVLQHLLLGMNAHINLDLGVAAAAVSTNGRLPELRRDFDAINAILCDMLDDVQDRLARIWPLMALLDRAGCRTDEAVMHFSILRARDAAWDVATTLARLDGEDVAREVERVDEWAAVLARLIRTPGVTVSLANLVIRVTELGGVTRAIKALT